MIGSNNPNAILRALREVKGNARILVEAECVGMKLERGSLVGTAEQWQQLKFFDLLYGRIGA